MQPRRMADVLRNTDTQKRQPKGPQNYRAIAVICIIGRIYSEVLSSLTQKQIDTKQAEEHSGFRPGGSQ
jgi:hypothetical protein